MSPMTLRGVTLRNRAWVSPMCQYTSVDGHPTDWHLVHLGGLARGGAGLVFQEATAVTAEGRISPWDAGIWTDAQAADYERITAFVRAQGAAAGIQLGHAGRKASTSRPWEPAGSVPVGAGGWPTVSSSALAYGEYAEPLALTSGQVGEIVQSFADAAQRALQAGFQVLEIHAAHGYLLHQFLSPLSNQRQDEYGGDFAGRTRLTLDVVRAVRAAVPDNTPLVVRVSATDWVEGGWDVPQTVELARLLRDNGVDLIDVSSGGLSPLQQIAVGPGYQVPFARAVREGAGIPVAAVGLITQVDQAERLLADGSADAVLLARELLRNPHWPMLAEAALDSTSTSWPPQYVRGIPRR